ncbi:15933_t:CDS:2, partial [Entrophospora sp. SA101]
ISNSEDNKIEDNSDSANSEEMHPHFLKFKFGYFHITYTKIIIPKKKNKELKLNMAAFDRLVMEEAGLVVIFGSEDQEGIVKAV